MEYFAIFTVAVAAIMFVSWLIIRRDLKIARLKAKLSTNKFWLKHQKEIIRDLESLILDQKNEIKSLNNTIDAFEEGVIEMSDDDDDDEDDEELGEDYTGIEADIFDAKAVGH